MLIDWFTVGAQALNFAILVWLMKRFLYRPVLAAIDAREKRIADQLADADARTAEAGHERDAFRDRNDAFDRQRADLLARAGDDATAERRRLIDEAGRDAVAAAVTRRDALEREASALDRAIGLRTREEVLAIARETLADLASVALEQQICDVFVARLRALQGPARDRLAEAVRTATDGVLVRSAFELPATQRAAIGQALEQTFDARPPLRFEVAPELVAGVALSVNGQRLDWSIADRIESLGSRVAALMETAATVHGADAVPSDPAAPAQTDAASPTRTAGPAAQPIATPA